MICDCKTSYGYKCVDLRGFVYSELDEYDGLIIEGIDLVWPWIKSFGNRKW